MGEECVADFGEARAGAFDDAEVWFGAGAAGPVVGKVLRDGGRGGVWPIEADEDFVAVVAQGLAGEVAEARRELEATLVGWDDDRDLDRRLSAVRGCHAVVIGQKGVQE